MRRGRVLGARDGRLALGRRRARAAASDRTRLVGLAMAFGSGALIAAVAYELVLDAFATDVEPRGPRLRGRRARVLRGRLGDRPSWRSGAQEHGRGDKRARRRARTRSCSGLFSTACPSRSSWERRSPGRRRARSPSSSACSSRTCPRRCRAMTGLLQAGGRVHASSRMWSGVVAVSVVAAMPAGGSSTSMPDRRRCLRDVVRRRRVARDARRHAHARGVRARRPRGRAAHRARVRSRLRP